MFVHLHSHSQYSVLDACPTVEELADKAAQYGMPATALTDHGNMYGAVEFYKACLAKKVKPIIGCEVYVAPNSRFDMKKERGEKAAYHLTLLAKNMQGYRNLCKLTSMAFLEGFYYHPRIDLDILEQHCEGLICLSGCMSSMISNEAMHGTEESLEELINWHQKVFKDDFYIEVQRHPMSGEDLQADGIPQETWLLQRYQEYIASQEKLNKVLIALAKRKNIPLVATNDSHYLDRNDWKAHEILLNIQSGEPCEIWEKDSLGNPKFRVLNPKRRTYPSHECYFKSSEQMIALFHDLPEAISSTLEIAEKCDLKLDFSTKHYPVYVPPELEGKSYTKEEREKAAENFLWKLCEERISQRYTPDKLAKIKELFPDKDPMQVVRERLDREMGVIVPKGMSDYLLIVWDFIDWAKRNGIPMGPGRGSGVGSIVLYLIGVTDIEPLRFHLFFERFINPDRISYPDIDVDICMDKRNDVIQYTLRKYGKENIAQIITFGTMKAKMAIRDIGRVLSVPLVKVNAIAKLVPDDLNITLETALEKDADLRAMAEQDEDARRIIDFGKKLEGSIRSTGTHAAGIIISGQPLVNLIPVCVAKDSDMPVTQYSMKPVEAVGMLKMDFLGLKTLTAIQICVDEVKANHGRTIDWVNLPLDDKPTFDLLNQGKTLGVFQLESGGMQDLARNLHLDKFEEIIAVGSLYRPGPMDMIPSFINRKHGREPIEYDHPWMKEILSETYGIMVYQEQVMQIASKLAKYSLGEGDVLRRAMGKKDMAEMSKQRAKFRQGALENEIDETTAMQIFDKMEKFASYGFNKSHAAAYGYLSYVTAYLKANYPKEWMAALMTCDSSDLTKVSKFIRECQAMQIPILPPDINEADKKFAATPSGVRFAMCGIKGVGEGVVENIIEERKKKGHFKSLYDFIERLNAKVGKKTVENLVDAGCFDFTGWSRDALRISIEPISDAVAKEQKEANAGVMSFFTMMGDTAAKQFEKPPIVKKETPKREILLKEKELLGFFLTGHPMDAYKPLLSRLSCIPLSRVEEMDNNNVFRSAFIVETVQVKISSKSQRKFAILTISDGMESYELPVWSDLFEEKQTLFKENQLLYAVLQTERKEESIQLSCRWIDDLTQAKDAMIEACDNAYDRAKMQSAKGEYKKAARPPGEKKSPQASKPAAIEAPKKLKLAIDAENARLGHILQIKSIFRASQGKSTVQIDFNSCGKTIAAIHIGEAWGVDITPELLKQLREIPVLQQV